MNYVPIKLIDPKNLPRKVPSHVDLEAIIAEIKGKHKKALAHELRLMFANYLRHGHFSYNRILFEFTHSAYARKKLTEILSICSVVVKEHVPGRSAKQRKFTFRGIQKAPIYIGGSSSLYSSLASSVSSPHIPVEFDALSVAEEFQAWRIIPAAWLTWRYAKWSEWCNLTGHKQNLDIGGVTDWGLATYDVLDSVLLPATAASEFGQTRIDKLSEGVPRMVKRTRNRLYHPLTNLQKEDRRLLLIDGQPVGEVDQSATFVTLISSKLEPEHQAPILAKVSSGIWYVQFQDIYNAWVPGKIKELKGEDWTDEQIAKRFEGGVKSEFQRQCLFWHDERDRPLWDELVRNHSELALVIYGMHKKHKPSGLYDMLTRAESAIFVDDAIPELASKGIKALGIHDALIVTKQHLVAVRGVLERLGEEHLGFVPAFKISGDTAVDQSQNDQPDVAKQSCLPPASHASPSA